MALLNGVVATSSKMTARSGQRVRFIELRSFGWQLQASSRILDRQYCFQLNPGYDCGVVYPLLSLDLGFKFI